MLLNRRAQEVPFCSLWHRGDAHGPLSATAASGLCPGARPYGRTPRAGNFACRLYGRTDLACRRRRLGDFLRVARLQTALWRRSGSSHHIKE